MRTLPAFVATLALLAAGAATAATPDPAVAEQLKSLDLTYEIDEDGDYKLVFEAGEDGERSQVVFVRSPVETYGELSVREIWSPGYKSDGKAFPVAVANRLLESSSDQKLGGWIKQEAYAVFVVKIDARSTAQQLRDAIEAASEVADTVEAELTPGKDEF